MSDTTVAAPPPWEAGRRPRYYQPDDVDAVVMRLDVRAWASARVADPNDAGVCT